MNRGDYDDARQAVETPAPQLPARAWHVTDKELVLRIAAEHYGADDEMTGVQWANLAARIARALAGEFATFSKDDARLVQAEHLRVLALRLVDDDVRAAVRVRSRALSRLGVLVTEAARGRLELVR